MPSITDCASGTSAAPNVPCSRRNSTISSMFWAMPHSMEASVKPVTQISSSSLMPKRLASQPTGAVMTAAATT